MMKRFLGLMLAAVTATGAMAPPTTAQYRAALERIARAVDYPVLAPDYVPAGLVPKWPRNEPYGVQLLYVPPVEAESPSPEPLRGVDLMEVKATPTDVATIPRDSERVVINGVPGWFKSGFRNPDGTGAAAWLSFVTDGTRVAINSFALDREGMLRVAGSLRTVPGAHPPLPRPVPRTLAVARRRVTFPVFVPTEVPPGITPEPPVGGEQPEDPVGITYHRPDGSEALGILSGPAGCCLAADGRKRVNPVRIRDGVTGYLLEIPPRYGGPILWWEQDGAYVALSSPIYNKEQLLRMAATVSSAADVGRTELPAQRPGPGTPP